MKAKFYEVNGKAEIKLSNDTSYVSKKNETKESFIARVEKIVKDDLLEDEFEMVEITKELIEQNDDATLLDAAETATGLQKVLLTEVLTERGIIKPKVVREKIVKKEAEEMKASEHYKEAEAQIGRYVSFSPFKKDEVHEGFIRGVALNKTNTRVYYTVVSADATRRCCAVLNETVKFIDAPVVEEVAKPAKAAKSKKGATDEVAEDLG